MAGHSKFKNIMFRKGAQDKKRAKIFAKLGREIQIASKHGGVDPDSNHRLRTAIDAAKAANVPKDNIERAIKKGSSNENDNLEEIKYEGFGPGGTALIVETMTDNKNRTISEIRQIFSKNGGSITENGSVSHSFSRKGELVYKAKSGLEDKIFDYAVESGADDVINEEQNYIVYCDPDKIINIKEKISKLSILPISVSLTWISSSKVKINKEDGKKLFNLINQLEDNEDVQNISSNYDISKEVFDTIEFDR
ncbi:MAG: putative transcriptional regulatory protein [Alphaproteobacteria bacterium MarineAlpha6_Bin4]|nr:MAG: putative transcriptional regulatory protein [Alphaproteobacteria bacterium MarineAlpha6_Bin3]PPR38034.1 MAG: putative transcriptional regulatory protein [Alphaproteobacteria bacterium MarineAlpha6_Bin4]|tara:strand:- start:4183 stop:4935 length:753 start_codon:yes stop_codon:yes gene_type:complete